ncbi:FAD binding domain-containing protein [Paenibacillus sp. IB182496]|uniref:FAD binding domain-containing protein n=1 Tax=Paenibacillus sabuli TaxID=2772509 RepID=A0A927BQB2_9BACL|nr:FAD binding domain-containing protein [Paenibacillus sabuli]MBD2843730.1 FAD binding domain-containing protein [Paenibacillus sabuli]
MAWIQPRSVAEAVELLQQRRARVVCGGTDLFVGGPARPLAPEQEDWLDVRRIPELCGARRTEEGLEIGAAVTAAQLWEEETYRALPALQQAAKIVGGWQIQNRASLGGNVANASPAADMVVPLMAYRAKVRLAGASGERRMALQDFIRGPRMTALQEGELIVSLIVPERMLGTAQVFLRHDQRAATDISIVSVALAAAVAGGEIAWASAAVGAAAARAYTLSEEEEQLWRGRLDAKAMARLGALYAARSAPITDVRAGEDYRRSLVDTYIQRAARTVLGQ